MNFIAELKKIQRPYLTEIVEINRKYSFSSFAKRTKEDEDRLKYLFSKMQELDDKYNELNPVEPCPECGQKRKASLGSVCINHRNCNSAPPLGG